MISSLSVTWQLKGYFHHSFQLFFMHIMQSNRQPLEILLQHISLISKIAVVGVT